MTAFAFEQVLLTALPAQGKQVILMPWLNNSSRLITLNLNLHRI